MAWHVYATQAECQVPTSFSIHQGAENFGIYLAVTVTLELLTLSSLPYLWDRNQLFQNMSGQAISAQQPAHQDTARPHLP